MSALDKYREPSGNGKSNGTHKGKSPIVNRLPNHPQAGKTAADEKKFDFIDSAEFSEGDFRPEWLVKNVLVKNEPAVAAGASKTLKTSIAGVDLGVSLAAGLPFLGKFEVPHAVNVAIASGESGRPTLQETAKRICQAKGITLGSLGAKLNWCFTVPILSDGEAMTIFVDGLVDRGVGVVVLDPLYLALGNVDAKNMFETGAVLRFVSVLMVSRGITPIILHHANRKNNTFDPMELTDIAYSGCDQFARQFILVSRRERYQMDGNHKLWLKIGGSAGHGGLFGVDVAEGITGDDFGGRRWEVSVELPGELIANETEQRARQKSDKKRIEELGDEAAVLKVIDQSGAEATTRTKIRELAGVSRGRVDSAIERLKAAGKIVLEVGEVQRGKGAKVPSEVYRRRQEGEAPTPGALDFY